MSSFSPANLIARTFFVSPAANPIIQLGCLFPGRSPSTIKTSTAWSTKHPTPKFLVPLSQYGGQSLVKRHCTRYWGKLSSFVPSQTLADLAVLGRQRHWQRNSPCICRSWRQRCGVCRHQRRGRPGCCRREQEIRQGRLFQGDSSES